MQNFTIHFKSVVFAVLVYLLSTSLTFGFVRLGIDANVTKQLKSQIEWVPKHFKDVRECLEDWHRNDENGGILAQTPSLTSAQCRTITDPNRVSVSYDTSTGKICIATSDKLVGLENKYITCTPYNDNEGNASFLYCNCKHNISYTGTGMVLSYGEVSPFLEDIGIMNCKYDNTITSCD